jgi:hypothetical protein
MAGSFGYEKNIMTLVCKWERILYFQNKKYCSTTTIAADTSYRHQILMILRKTQHPVSILKIY